MFALETASSTAARGTIDSWYGLVTGKGIDREALAEAEVSNPCPGESLGDAVSLGIVSTATGGGR